tara:strand:+ start:488 stop:733 length:246 start_codon:yes stop_codon:yes gene_type:complete
LEAIIGRIISAIAVGKSKNVASIGTATNGSPIPRIPLTVPAKIKVIMQNTSDSVPRVNNNKILSFLISKGFEKVLYRYRGL